MSKGMAGGQERAGSRGWASCTLEEWSLRRGSVAAPKWNVYQRAEQGEAHRSSIRRKAFWDGLAPGTNQ